jgi:hypothetical protein
MINPAENHKRASVERSPMGSFWAIGINKIAKAALFVASDH